MKIIIPMAGRGSRLRPHTLTVPKPLIPIAGKPIVQRIVEDFNQSFPSQIEEVAFVIGDFGKEVEAQLAQVAEGVGAKCSIYYQDQPLGPAHAIYCARESLSGNCIVAFADTLFKADFSFNTQEDGIIWVQKVDNPSSFGVVQVNEQGYISAFVEKSPVFVSDLAIVGIYYFRDGDYFRSQVEHLIDNDIKDKGEFQITSVLELMKEAGTQFKPAQIEEWLDCGNKANILATNQRILELKNGNERLIPNSITLENATIIPPCYIGERVKLVNTVVGPYVSIGSNSVLENCVIRESIIQHDSSINNAILQKSMIGSQVDYTGSMQEISIGDYTTIGK